MKTKDGRVILSAQVLLAGARAGKICPICGDEKTVGAYTCKGCRSDDPVVTKAVKAFDTAVETAKTGHTAAVATGDIIKNIGGKEVKMDTIREILLPQVLANVRIPKNAQMRYPRNQSIQPYLEFVHMVDGGYVKMFIFGATKADLGQTIAAIVEMKVRVDDFNNEVPYLRAQFVPDVMSTLDITFIEPDLDLPCKDWCSTLRKDDGEDRALLFTFGYKPIEIAVRKTV